MKTTHSNNHYNYRIELDFYATSLEKAHGFISELLDMTDFTSYGVQDFRLYFTPKKHRLASQRKKAVQ